MNIGTFSNIVTISELHRMSYINHLQKTLRSNRKFVATSFITFVLATLSSCQTTSTKLDSAISPASKPHDADKLIVVDCLLPGQIRKLGSRFTYLSPRRPVKTSAIDCEIRGGEYTSFDRADYRTALNVWLPKAKEGDATAQTYVGEIFEKGLGTQADYRLALSWYRKAADQGYARAQVNLGFLYEKGLGVEKDLAHALNWYRKASGLVDDELQYASSIEATAASNAELTRLRSEVDLQQKEIQKVEGQLQKTRYQLQQQEKSLLKSEQEAERLHQLLGSMPAAPSEVTDNQTAELEEALLNQKIEIKKQRVTINTLKSSLAQQNKRLNEELQAARMQELGLQEDLSRQSDEIKSLRAKLVETQELLSKSHKQMAVLEPEFKQNQQRLLMASEELNHAKELASAGEKELQTLKNELKRREFQMQGQRETKANLLVIKAKYEKLLDQFEQKETQEISMTQDLARQEADIASWQKRLVETQQKLDTTQSQLSNTVSQLKRNQMQLSELQSQLTHAQGSVSKKEAEVRKLKEELNRSGATLQAQRDHIVQLHSDSLDYRERLAAIETERRLDTLKGPVIEILDPPVVLTRGLPSVRLRSNVKQRLVVGKVTASAGLLSFTVNGNAENTDATGTFRVNIPIEGNQVPVKMVAVDTRGKQASIEFLIIPKLRVVQEPKKRLPAKPAVTSKPNILANNVNFGTYNALIIGNNQYYQLPNLETAINDARATGRLLQEKYGFNTTLLIDANRYEILSALNKMREQLSANDNLLIYYAGHGELDAINSRGHWLPVDAQPDNPANWISSTAITDMLNTIQAKQILVVADSCYSGAMTRTSISKLPTDISTELQLEWLKVMTKTRSRTVLTSGGLKPVMDEGGGGVHSVFAKVFLDELRKNNKVLETDKLYNRLFGKVQKMAAAYGIDQQPEYAPIQHGGHEAGTFFFVPVQ